MDPIQGYHRISPEDWKWREAIKMFIPNADLLERTGSQLLGARIWRYPPHSAGTWHRHIKAEEFYFVLQGTGHMRVGQESFSVPQYGSVLVGPAELRQVFNPTDEDTLWLILGAPDHELEPGETFDLSRYYPEDPTQLPPEMAGTVWPPKRD